MPATLHHVKARPRDSRCQQAGVAQRHAGILIAPDNQGGLGQPVQPWQARPPRDSVQLIRVPQWVRWALQTIGRVTTRARGASTFNATPASVQTINTQTFQEQGQQQVQRILDQTPGIVIDHPGTSATNAAPGAITFPSIRGGLGFETSSLIDGHPLAVGNFGDAFTWICR